MDNPSEEKPFLHAIKGKVIAASVLACIAITLALGITYLSFRGLLTTVDNLSSPNEKLRMLNIFFQRVTQLDQQQRADAISNPQKPFENFLQESKTLLLTIDSLRAMPWQDSLQYKRLDDMAGIITQRDKLFLSYLKVKSVFVYNQSYGKKLDSLSKILSKSPITAETKALSTQKKTKTTFAAGELEKKKNNRSFFSRLFGKKESAKPLETRVDVLKNLGLTRDSLSNKENAIAEVGKIMKRMEQSHVDHNRDLIKNELQLINTNTVLIHQLLNILHQVEGEELVLMKHNSEAAFLLVNNSILKIGFIILVFFLAVAILLFFILTDISKSNYYRAQLVKAKNEAEQLTHVKQRFLANMSHEIRTPLQSILGFAEQLKQKNIDEEAIEAIHNSSEHLLHIVNEVLDYSRIESGKLQLVSKPFNLLEVVHEVSSGIRIQAQQRSLNFNLLIAPHDIFILGDAFRLKQILYNLLGNAIKFTTVGSVSLSLRVREVTNKVECIFEISDTGIGMNIQDVDRVFEQFEQASIDHQYGGTGLGLTIVKKLVEAQQGNMQVKSEPNKGSVFTVSLTFEKATMPQEDHSLQVANISNSIQGKVMVVDDDPLIVRLCSIILEKYQVAHIVFQNPETALTYKYFDELSLIFLDIRMPKMSGIELCKQIRNKVKSNTKIVALTAHVLPHEKANLIEAGFDDVFTKPFREQDFVQFIGLSPASLKSKIKDGNSLTIDLSTLRRMTMGDESLLRSIVEQFVVETETDLLKINQYILESNAAELRETVHKLAGRTGQMGLEKMSASFKTIENNLSANKSLSQLLPEIQNTTEQMGIVLISMKEQILEHQES